MPSYKKAVIEDTDFVGDSGIPGVDGSSDACID